MAILTMVIRFTLCLGGLICLPPQHEVQGQLVRPVNDLRPQPPADLRPVNPSQPSLQSKQGSEKMGAASTVPVTPAFQAPNRSDFENSAMRPLAAEIQSRPQSSLFNQMSAARNNSPSGRTPLTSETAASPNLPGLGMGDQGSVSGLSKLPANPSQEGLGSETANTIQQASYIARQSNDGLAHGVANPEVPNSLLQFGAPQTNASAGNVVDPPEKAQHPIEQKYAQSWRDSLTSAEIEGEFLEVYQIIQTVPHQAQPAVLASYWKLAEAIVKWKIQSENKQLWLEAVSQNSNAYTISMTNSITQEVNLSEAAIRNSQEHFARLTRGYGLPNPARPADAPFIGPYSTKIAEFKNGLPEQWSTLATEIDDKWKAILDDDVAFNWASTQWSSSRYQGSAETMAAAFQLRQRALMILAGHVSEYNQAIANYALNVAGYNKTTEQRVAMLLRQPIIGGEVMDIGSHPLFKSQNQMTDTYQGNGMVVQVSYTDMNGNPIADPYLNNGVTMADRTFVRPTTAGYPNQLANSGVMQNSNPTNAYLRTMNAAGIRSNAVPATAMNNQAPLTRTASRNLGLRVGATRAVPSNAGAWQEAQQAASVRR